MIQHSLAEIKLVNRRHSFMNTVCQVNGKIKIFSNNDKFLVAYKLGLVIIAIPVAIFQYIKKIIILVEAKKNFKIIFLKKFRKMLITRNLYVAKHLIVLQNRNTCDDAFLFTAVLPTLKLVYC